MFICVYIILYHCCINGVCMLYQRYLKSLKGDVTVGHQSTAFVEIRGTFVLSQVESIRKVK